jgi:hypothetical protein
MTKDFQITGVVAPLDWTWVVTDPLGNQVLPGHPPPDPGVGWLGSVDFYAGTPIDPVGTGGSNPEVGTFGVVVSFLGDVAFCTEQFPTPEPATLALLAFGGLLVRRRR